MLLDMIAIVILAGMMLIPVVNIFAGVIIGAGLGGAAGACAGLSLALIVTAGERVLVAWLAAEANEHGARNSNVARAPSRMTVRPADAVLATAQSAEAVRDDYLLETPMFVRAMGRAPHGAPASLSA
ncbi:hypothetical protein GIW81_08020 [Hyphomicrobium sp. xq]|uniref:Uncharacterized protein n=1 Tax=Hyphomicrobium album TaxID=2665159 RepID=A0A6I3KK12_9HYPH|nr:hypothetical protein [Hyphomicrobium album]MTD94280.1 hypothetical protein [Hyphomicrobium album]